MKTDKSRINMRRKLSARLGVLLSRSRAPYIGCYVDYGDIECYIEEMRIFLGDSSAKFEENRKHRDGDVYHMTVIGPREYLALPENRKSDCRAMLGREVVLELVGLGRVTGGRNEALFVVVDCDEGNKFRERFGFGRRDFHITLGFADADIHGVAKDISVLI